MLPDFFERFTDIDDTMIAHETRELYYKTASLYKPVIDDIFNFNKTMYYFVNDFLSHLKSLILKILPPLTMTFLQILWRTR